MARIEPSFLFSEISGSVGANTVQKNNLSLALGQRAVVQGRVSNAQYSYRNAFNYVRRQWSQLTPDERQSWNALAELIFQKSLQAKHKQTRGYFLFVRYNVQPHLNGDPIMKEAPAAFSTTNILQFLWVQFPAGFMNVLAVPAITQYPYYVQIWARQSYKGPQTGTLTPWRLLVRDKVFSLGFNITDPWLAAFKTINTGNYAAVRFQVQSAGLFPSEKYVDGHLI